ncbi:MAG: TVP38/TMEM64 family protein [Caldilineaceae bacterium]|nr:TVP38/TMEM64 family protein [Caldilineaceae bacterium]
MITHFHMLPQTTLRWRMGAIGVGSIMVILLFWPSVWNLLRIVSDRDAVIAYLSQFGLAGMGVLGFVLVFQVIVALIPGHVLMVAGGYVYGFVPAFCLNLLCTVGGSQLAFLLARWAGRPVVERLAPADALDKWQKVSAQKGLIFFMFSFMLPVFPADVMNYVAGLSALSWRKFLIANLMGRIPGVVLLTATGAYGYQLPATAWLVILPVALLMFLIWRRVMIGRCR